MNLYSYVGNNSLSRVDPTGLTAAQLNKFMGQIGLGIQNYAMNNVNLSLTVSGGYIVGGNVTATITPLGGLNVYAGGGLAMGLDVQAAVNFGATLVSGKNEGLTTKINVAGGLGGAGGLEMNFGQMGVDTSYSIGTGGGGAAAVTTGYTWNFPHLFW